MYAEAGTIDNTEAIFSEVSVKTLFEASKKGKEPLRQFMIRYTDERYRVLFRDLAQQMAAKTAMIRTRSTPTISVSSSRRSSPTS